MSFVTAAPELIEAAAHDLSGIGSTLGEATNFAAGPTTSIAAAGTDEVSVAIAELFGSHGQQFQALSAKAAAFHDEFVGVLKSAAGAYAGSEVANVEQLLGSEVGSIAHEINTFGATVAGPYRTLFADTSANLQSLGSAITANPQPLLHQVIGNQAGYAQRIDTGLLRTVWNLRSDVANLPANIQTGAHALSTVNPEALVQHFVNNQVNYGQTISTSVGAAAHDFTTELRALPASLQTAAQYLADGNTTGAVNALASGFRNLFLTGFTSSLNAQNVVTVTPTGALGDLLPILSIPGQMAQNFANLFPAGSIAGHVTQNFANVVKTVTDLNVTSTVSFAIGNINAIDIDTSVGLPLVLALDALGGPINALNALGSSAHAITSAFQSGNVMGAVEGILDAPAKVANGFLNGQTTLPLSTEVFGWPTTLDIPLDGILVPAAEYGASVPAVSWASFFVTGTPIGGIVPFLLTDLPADLAAALGGPPAPVIPLTLP